ncbi:hypothetical protein QQP08_025188 [Theobroma cacao]|uniref:Uncharacterized protein n=1 Tax=Theobroma cacao TaxID=3641 RepID=A0A061GXG7_THECC|nr:Uncharacterized protein TCM_042185 [Theobroma cacao]WRX32701.1 hypothetical protein QQP08_025188 [Theobroma cacao]
MFHTMEEDIKTWRWTAFSCSGLSIPPSMEPSSSSQPPAELVFSGDKHFALHGKIWLLAVVLTFVLFLAFIIFLLPRLRRRTNYEADVSDSNVNPGRRNCPLMSLRKRRRTDEEEVGEERQYSIRINEKFPL